MVNDDILLEAVSERLQYTGVSIKNPYTFKVERGKCYTVLGENGSGKSTLGKIIEKGWNIATNKILGDKKNLIIKNIQFSDIHSLTGCKDSYYQQRYESTMNEDIPTVEELISDKLPADVWDNLCQKLNVSDISHKRINYLSSGELRKFLIINLFTSVPDILIVDNPYIGLDAASRELFNDLLCSVAKQGTAVMLLLCNTNEIPKFCDYVIPMKNMTIGESRDIAGRDIEQVRKDYEYLFNNLEGKIELPFEFTPNEVTYKNAFELKRCDVKYGSNIILKDVSWRVDAGEKWALLGENGAGKSTLLSLVYADNPQGYSNDITLFDHRRGSGESIWDIKKRIGYISPELHLYFNNGETVMSVLGSGFHSNVGCYRRVNEEQQAIVMKWLAALGMGHLADRRFITLSSGEQRMILLVRTFLKNASLLILDEPLHGLDMAKKKLVLNIINKMCDEQDLSLIYVTHYEHEIPKSVNRTFRLIKQRI